MELEISNKKVFFLSELAFVLYIWSFTYSRPLLHLYPSFSSGILVFITIFCFILSFSKKLRVQKEKVFFIIFFIVFIVLDNLFRNYLFSRTFLYDILYSVIVPLVLLTRVKSFNKLLLYHTNISLIIICLLGSDPFFNYVTFTDYMNYGLKVGLPCFIGTYLGYRYFNKKVMFLGLLASSFAVILFSNRSVSLCAVLFVVIFEFVTAYNKKKYFGRAFILILLIGFLSSFVKTFLLLIYNFLDSVGLTSYALYKIIYQLDSREVDSVVLSGREDLWEKAIILLEENPIVGNGSSFYINEYGTYPHNLILDISISFGMLGLILFLGIIMHASFKIFTIKEIDLKITVIWFLCLWFPILMFSSTYSISWGLWSFVLIGCTYNKKV
ncbi:O-antigen ligase family protein [Myroides injenensis]|uniref:O-antigen ligase family protein n=1 Tax=Myroides injenensis TaxID=1183151 RepID=UPI000289AE86|nr:O-antigen ligase family protein [Myroides injenensis]